MKKIKCVSAIFVKNRFISLLFSNMELLNFPIPKVKLKGIYDVEGAGYFNTKEISYTQIKKYVKKIQGV